MSGLLTMVCFMDLFSCVLTDAGSSAANINIVDKKLEDLMNRIKQLENRDIQYQTNLTTLKNEFAEREKQLLQRIEDLESKCADGCVTTGTNLKTKGIARDDDVTQSDDHHGVAKNAPNQITENQTEHRKLSEDGLTETRSRRAVAKTEVAFFAIAPDYDFANMGQGEKLTYDTPYTNLGGSFDHANGIFIAPIRGTYAIFVTVGGRIPSTNYFYVDVNGAMMAKMLLSPTAQQSSQVIIVTMKPGESVTVRSGMDNNGAYGAYYTSIAGFLLYENVNHYASPHLDN